jgi:hypothetical protein
MERGALSNGDWIRAAANAIAFGRTGHAAAAPKHQSRCNVWMGRHGEFKCDAAGQVRARPQLSVMRFDNRPADRQPKPQTARFRGVESLEHAVNSAGGGDEDRMTSANGRYCCKSLFEVSNENS